MPEVKHKISQPEFTGGHFMGAREQITVKNTCVYFFAMPVKPGMKKISDIQVSTSDHVGIRHEKRLQIAEAEGMQMAVHGKSIFGKKR